MVEGGERGEGDSFPSLSPGSQGFSLTGAVSAASSSVSTFLSFIFTRTASISWPAEGICRGEKEVRGGKAGKHIKKKKKNFSGGLFAVW